MNFLHLTVWSSRARLTSDQMSFCFARRLHPQFVVQSLSRYFWVLSLGSNLPSAFQKLLVNTGWKYILKRIHVKICHKKCLPSFNELARFSQFIKYTHFLVPFFCCRKPPFGPHFTQNQVPILKNWRPLPMWERWHWYWVYSRILFLHSCILIL